MFKILFGETGVRNKIWKLVTVSWRTYHYTELESAQIEKTKTLTAFLKRNEYIKNENLSLNLSDIKFSFFRTERMLVKTFLQKAISQYP